MANEDERLVEIIRALEISKRFDRLEDRLHTIETKIYGLLGGAAVVSAVVSLICKIYFGHLV